MKLVIITESGKILGKLKLNQELLRRHEILAERICETIARSIKQTEEEHDDRIVETLEPKLENMDEDGTILGVPLKLSDACTYDFSKHIDSIATNESSGRDEIVKRSNSSISDESKLYDARYKEKFHNLIRYKK